MATTPDKSATGSAFRRGLSKLREHKAFTALASIGLFGALDLISYLQTGASLMEQLFGAGWLPIFVQSFWFKLLCLAVVIVGIWWIGFVSMREERRAVEEDQEGRERAMADLSALITEATKLPALMAQRGVFIDRAIRVEKAVVSLNEVIHRITEYGLAAKGGFTSGYHDPTKSPSIAEDVLEINRHMPDFTEVPPALNVPPLIPRKSMAENIYHADDNGEHFKGALQYAAQLVIYVEKVTAAARALKGQEGNMDMAIRREVERING